MGHFEGPEPSNLYVSPKRGAFSSMVIQNYLFQKILDLCSLKGTFFDHFWSQKPFRNAIKMSASFFDDFGPSLASILAPFGAQGPSKNHQKSSWDPLWSSLGPQRLPIWPSDLIFGPFWTYFGTCWVYFGSLLARFCILLCLKIPPSN